MFSVPGVALLFQDHFLVVMASTLTSSKDNFQFDSWELPTSQYFIDSVLLGHWGPTTIFASRVVLQIRFRTILHVTADLTGGFTIWSTVNGLFKLKLEEAAPQLTAALARCDGGLPPLLYLHRIRTEEDLIQTWKNSRLSAIEFLLGLNGLHQRSFIDLDRYPTFPEVRSGGWASSRFPTQAHVTALLSPVNPFHTFERILNRGRTDRKLTREACLSDGQRSFLPADYFFHALGNSCDAALLRGALDHEPRLFEWINATFSSELPANVRAASAAFGHPHAKYLCQALTVRGSPGDSVLYAGESVRAFAGIWQPAHQLFVHHHRGELTISLEHGSGVAQARSDGILAFVSNIAIGEQGVFFVADTTVGVSLCFRIE
jgi:hypothetical protein